MCLLPLLLALAATPPGNDAVVPSEGTLTYEGPSQGAPDPSAHGFTTYAKGDAPFVAVDEANLRGSATLDAPVVRTLRLGSALQVLEVASGPVLVKDRVDRWYRVRTTEAEPREGFVLGNVLTPLASTRDLDGDGQEEHLAVSFTSDFVVRVRVLEPELAATNKRALTALDFLVPPVVAGRRGGRVRWVPVPAKELGLKPSPRAFGLELCGTQCVVHAVSYEAKTGVLGSLSVPPEVREGVTLYARPKQLLSLPLKGSEEDMISSETVPCHVIGRARGGAHDRKEILSCLFDISRKAGPNEQAVFSFVMMGGKKLLRLRPEDEGVGKMLEEALAKKGYRMGPGMGSAPQGLLPPARLYADARGAVEWRWSSADVYVPSALEVAFVHPTLGAVMTTRPGAQALEAWNPLGFNGFYVPEPGRGFLFYAYQRDLSPGSVRWKEARPKGVEYSLEYDMGCGRVKAVDPAPADVKAADLVEVGEVKGAGPLFALKDIAHPEVERAWKELREVPESTLASSKAQYKSKEAFFASAPRFFWRDSFGRLLRLRRVDLTPHCMAEPIVYFYPERTMQVRYTLAPIVQVARAEPLARDNSWTFLASPQGRLEEVDVEPGRARRSFKHLFWEGTSMRFEPPAEGVCVPGPGTRAYFSEVLPRLGLMPHETEDFLAAWVPRMEGAAFHVIGFHPREVVDALAPVQVSPPPTHLLRILMDATPVEDCPELRAPVLPDEVPARGGFTVVEWGGVLRAGP